MSSRWLLYLVLAGLAGLASCTCGEDRPEGPEPALSPTRVPLPPVPRTRARPPVNVARQTPIGREMEQIQKVAEEMQRRARGGLSMRGPALMMAEIVKKIPAKRFPSTFRTFLDDLGDRLKQVQKSSDLKQDFNGMLDSCGACHRVYAKQHMIQLERLRVKVPASKGQGK